MTGLVARSRRARGIAGSLGGYLGLAIVLGVILVLIVGGVLPPRRWAPFGDVRVWLGGQAADLGALPVVADLTD